MTGSHVYKLATRGSKLALWQAHFVQEKLASNGIRSELMIVKTSGDHQKEKPLAEIGGKGVFVKELEQALLAKTADFAVHSLKDLPAETRKPFALPCFLARHPCEDVIIFSPSWIKKLTGASQEKWQAEDLQKLGALKIGTGSLRRESLLSEANPAIKTIAIHGNVDTRLAHLKAGKWDAIILARASIFRLPLGEEFPHFVLNSSWFIPCAGQGALVVETLAGSPLEGPLRQLSDPFTEQTVSIERKILAYLGGDCNLPAGVNVFLKNNELCCDTVIFNDDGQSLRMYLTQGQECSAEDFADLVWGELKHSGIESFLGRSLH